MSQKTRYVQVGLGSRSYMYTAAVVEHFASTCELVGLCDSNAGRLNLRAEWARERGRDTIFIHVPLMRAQGGDLEEKNLLSAAQEALRFVIEAREARQ